MARGTGKICTAPHTAAESGVRRSGSALTGTDLSALPDALCCPARRKVARAMRELKKLREERSRYAGTYYYSRRRRSAPAPARLNQCCQRVGAGWSDVAWSPKSGDPALIS